MKAKVNDEVRIVEFRKRMMLQEAGRLIAGPTAAAPDLMARLAKARRVNAGVKRRKQTSEMFRLVIRRNGRVFLRTRAKAVSARLAALKALQAHCEGARTSLSIHAEMVSENGFTRTAVIAEFIATRGGEGWTIRNSDPAREESGYVND